MKNLIGIILITVISAFLFTACGKSSRCNDEEIGSIPLSERAERFAPFEDGEKYYYEDQNGTLLTLHHTVSYSNGHWIKVRVIGEYEYNDYLGDSGTAQCYEYYSVFSKKNALKTADGEYGMHVTVSNKTESIDSSDERISFSFGHATQNVHGRYNLEKDTIETSNVTKFNSLELNGKTFNDVLRAMYVGNVTPEGEVVSLYLKEGQGIIGFEVDNKIFLLQQ